jgi:hypothetical protein
MPSKDSRADLESYLNATNGRDFEALERLVHPDYEDFYPQSGERIHGGANLRAVLEHYPGGYSGGGVAEVIGTEDRWVVTPAFSIVRVEGAGETFTGASRGRFPDGSEWFIVNIGQLRDGLVWRVQTFFAQTFEPAAWRSAWVTVDAQH